MMITTAVAGFWVRWLKADELEQLKLIESLTLPSNRIKDKRLHKHHVASVFNSYIEDLARVLATIPPDELNAYLKPYREWEENA